MEKRKITVKEAAALWSVSEQAIRKRIMRGTVASKNERGSVYVLVDDESTGRIPADNPASNAAAATPRLNDQIIELLHGRIEDGKARIASLERQVHEQWETIRNQQDLLKAHMVNERLLLEQLNEFRLLGAGCTEQQPVRARYRHHNVYSATR